MKRYKILSLALAVAFITSAFAITIQTTDEPNAEPTFGTTAADIVYFVPTDYLLKAKKVQYGTVLTETISPSFMYWNSSTKEVMGTTPSTPMEFTVQYDVRSTSGTVSTVKINYQSVQASGQPVTSIVFHDDSTGSHISYVGYDYCIGDTYNLQNMIYSGRSVSKVKDANRGTFYDVPASVNDILVGGNTTNGVQKLREFNITELSDPPISYSPPSNLTPITGANWYYTPTTTDGVNISVQGASWLSTAGNAVYGVPTEPGTYNVTLTLSKEGYVTSTHTFTLSVASQLVPTNSPTNGIIIYAV